MLNDNFWKHVRMIGGVAFVKLVIMLCLFDWMWYLLCHFDEVSLLLVRSNERMTPTKIMHIHLKNIYRKISMDEKQKRTSASSSSSSSSNQF